MPYGFVYSNASDVDIANKKQSTKSVFEWLDISDSAQCVIYNRELSLTQNQEYDQES